MIHDVDVAVCLCLDAVGTDNFAHVDSGRFFHRLHGLSHQDRNVPGNAGYAGGVTANDRNLINAGQRLSHALGNVRKNLDEHFSHSRIVILLICLCFLFHGFRFSQAFLTNRFSFCLTDKLNAFCFLLLRELLCLSCTFRLIFLGFCLFLAAVQVSICLFADFRIQFALLDLGFLCGKVYHFLLLGDFSIRFRFFDFFGAEIHLNLTGSICVSRSFISFSFQLCLGELQFIVAFCNRSLRFNFLGICSHLSIGLRAGYITGSLSTGNFSLFFHKLFLFNADSLDDAVVVALNIHRIPDILDVKSHDLKSHLSKVGASILDNAHSHLLAVRQNLVNGHIGDNLSQIALQNVIDFVIDALLVHAEKVRDGCLLAGHDVRLGVFQTGCLHFFIQNGRVFAVDLNRDNRVNPETYAVLRLNTCFRSLDIDFQKAHI